MSSPSRPDDEAAREPLADELRQQLMAAPELRDCPALQLLAASGDAGVSVERLEGSGAYVVQCHGGMDPDAQVRYMVRCSCVRSDTADSSTQTENRAVDEDTGFTRGEGAGAEPKEEVNENQFSITRCDKSTSTVDDAEASKYEEGFAMKEDNRYSDSPSPSVGDKDMDSSSLLPASSRERMLDEVPGMPQDAFQEVLREVKLALDTALSTSEIFNEECPTQPMSQASSLSIAAHSTAVSHNQGKAMAESILETIVDKEEENREPRLHLFHDELLDIYEHVLRKWEDSCSQLMAELSNRHNRFLAECRRRLENESRGLERDQLRQKLAEVRREVMGGMEDEFHAKCEDLDEWSESYLDSEFCHLFMTLWQNDRFLVLATALDDKIKYTLPNVEEKAHNDAAALWEKLVDRTALDMETLLNEFFHVRRE